QRMVQGAVENGRSMKKFRIFPAEQSHSFDYVDSFRRVQGGIENTRPSEPQVHQHEIDIEVASGAGLQRMLGALLAFELPAHFAQQAGQAPALAVAAPIDVLQLVKKRRAPLDVA